MSLSSSFYWHDYETWGADPKRDRASQFAGLRTDLDLNPIGKPLVIYAYPADDILPHPQACLVTGLTPQECREHGVPEAEFFQAIDAELSQPGTCALGYNSLRFDDEVTRFGFYRNFIDPYAREWRNGNSRWDLIDVVRLTHALRPDGIEWPMHDDGSTSFRLEQLTAANGIAHEGAHDALADVQATIELARLIKDKQARLFDYVFQHRHKSWYADVLNPDRQSPVLHVSARYPASLGCIAAVLPLARHPTNRNEIIVYDLRADPALLLDLPADQIRERLYTASKDLPEGEERIAIKTVKINHAPVVVPMNTLTDQAREKWQMPTEAEQRHREQLLAAPGLANKLAEVFGDSDWGGEQDADSALYGGFIPDADRRVCERVLAASPEQLASGRFEFQDARLRELFWRYRARNWPKTLSRPEREAWERLRRQRLIDGEAGGSLTLKAYRAELAKLAIDPGLSPAQRTLIDQLIEWPEVIGL